VKGEKGTLLQKERLKGSWVSLYLLEGSPGPEMEKRRNSSSRSLHGKGGGHNGGLVTPFISLSLTHGNLIT